MPFIKRIIRIKLNKIHNTRIFHIKFSNDCLDNFFSYTYNTTRENAIKLRINKTLYDLCTKISTFSKNLQRLSPTREWSLFIGQRKQYRPYNKKGGKSEWKKNLLLRPQLLYNIARVNVQSRLEIYEHFPFFPHKSLENSEKSREYDAFS